RLFRDLPKQTTVGSMGRGRVVDEHVDAAEPRKRFLHEPLGVGGATHVALEREDSASEAFDLLGQAFQSRPAQADLLEPFLVLVARAAARDIGRDDIGAGPSERDREGAADSANAPASGDQHAPSFEFAHGPYLPILWIPERRDGSGPGPTIRQDPVLVQPAPQASPFSLALPTTRGSHGVGHGSICRKGGLD